MTNYPEPKSPNSERYNQIAKKAMEQMSQNKGPGQAHGNKGGLSKAQIANPNAPEQIHENPNP